MTKHIRVANTWKEVALAGYYVQTDVGTKQVSNAWVWDGSQWRHYYVNTVPITISTTMNSWESMTVSWTNAADGARYVLKVGSTNPSTLYDGPNLSYTYNGLLPLTSYSFTIEAYVGSTLVATSSAWSPKTPDYPNLNFTAGAASWNAISLNWSAKNGSVDSFVLTKSGSTLYTGLGTSYQNTGLAASTSYTYTLQARRGATVIKSQTVSATTAARQTSSGTWYGPAASTSGGWTQCTARNLNGPTFPMPVNGYIGSWNVLVWSYSGYTGQFNPHIGGNYKGLRNCPGGRQYQGVDGGNMYLPAGSYSTGAAIGGNCSYATEWDSYGSAAWNYNVAVGQVNYWWYTDARSTFKTTPPWWHPILENRSIRVETWGVDHVTKAIVTDKESGEVLVDWESPEHEPALY